MTENKNRISEHNQRLISVLDNIAANKYSEKEFTQNGSYSAADDGIAGYSNIIINVTEERPVSTVGEHCVKVIDFDGSIIRKEYFNDGDSFRHSDTIRPNHSRLYFQQWCIPYFSLGTDYGFTVTHDCILGITYSTRTGKNEFDITLTEHTGLTVTLKMDGTKDWGDGISDTATSHTYTNYGDYIITCTGTAISSGYIFGQSSASAAHNTYCTMVRLATVTTIPANAFANCDALKYVTLSNKLITINYNAFNACPNLVHIAIPKSVTTLGTSAFSSCYNLKSICFSYNANVTTVPSLSYAHALEDISVSERMTTFYNSLMYASNLKKVYLPSSITSLLNYMFQYNCTLQTVILKDTTITAIPNSAFYQCYGLRTVKFPKTVTSIAANAFYQCRALLELDFTKHTTVPTLSSTTAFTNTNPLFKIIVPDALYNSWSTATNWATYADNIYKASEMLTE